jgi:hypothetical protein
LIWNRIKGLIWKSPRGWSQQVYPKATTGQRSKAKSEFKSLRREDYPSELEWVLNVNQSTTTTIENHPTYSFSTSATTGTSTTTLPYWPDLMERDES